jgi:Flp pilus assembly protein TadD
MRSGGVPLSFGLLVLASCAAHPLAIRAPSAERIIPAPPCDRPELEPALLAHVLRGLYFLNSGYPSAAIPHLRLALLYDANAPFLFERLSSAWTASGDAARARDVLEEGLKRSPTDPGLNLLAGRLRAVEKRYDAARAHLETALEDATLLGAAAPALLDALLWLQPSEALERAPALLARAPADEELGAGLAEALEDHGQLEQALGFYRRAREQHPKSERLAMGECRVLRLLGRFGDAADSLLPLFRYYPDDIGLYSRVAHLLYLAHRPEADSYHDEALRQSAGIPPARVQVAIVDLLSQRTDEAIALLRENLQLDATDLESSITLAGVMLSQGDFQGCAELLAGLPEAATPHVLLARCLAGAGRAAESLTAAARGLPRGPPRAVLTDLTLSLAQAFDAAAALSWRDQLVERLPGVFSATDVAISTAVLLDFRGEGREALALLTRSLEEAAADRDLQLRWAALAAEHGQLDAAIEALRRSLGGAPNDTALLNALGFTLADAGRELDEAEVLLRRAYRQAPGEGFVADSLGWLLLRRGELAGARRLLEEANAASPGDAEILRHLGDTYAALGLAAEAREAYLRALAARPGVELEHLLAERLLAAP